MLSVHHARLISENDEVSIVIFDIVIACSRVDAGLVVIEELVMPLQALADGHIAIPRSLVGHQIVDADILVGGDVSDNTDKTDAGGEVVVLDRKSVV